MYRFRSRIALVTLDVFLGLTAATGAIWVVPTLPRSWLMFFPDYTIPALGLGAVGILAFAAALALVIRPRLGAQMSVLAGVAIAIFEVVEALAAGNLLAPPAGVSGGGALWLQPFYFVLGLVMVVLGARSWRGSSTGLSAEPGAQPGRSYSTHRPARPSISGGTHR